VLLAVSLAACGDDKKESAASEDGCKELSGDAITLAVNPWTGSAVNAFVAKNVIECQLGTPVEIMRYNDRGFSTSRT
jgi:hypothetical protein